MGDTRFWADSVAPLLSSFVVSRDVPKEFEIRFAHVNSPSFAKFINHLELDPVTFLNPRLEYSIDFIAEKIQQKKSVVQSKYVQRRVYNPSNLMNIETTHTQKSVESRLASKRFVVSLSSEKPLNTSFSTDEAALIRFKARIIYDIKPTTAKVQWRVDATITHTLKSSEFNKERAYQIKAAMFPLGATPQTIVKLIDDKVATGYEIELEYVGTKSNLTLNDLPQDLLDLDFYVHPTDQHLTTTESNHRDSVLKAIYLQLKGHESSNQDLTVKQLTNQAVLLTKYIWTTIYPPVGYYLTPKIDGLRTIVYATTGSILVISGVNVMDLGAVATGTSICDAEAITVTSGEVSHLEIHVFDVMVVDSVNVTSKPFNERLSYIDQVVQELSSAATRAASTTIFVAKHYVTITNLNLSTAFKDMYGDGHNLDGLIITTPDRDYWSTKNYKWKPYSHMTIDFYAVLPTKEWFKDYMNTVEHPSRTYILFVSVWGSDLKYLGLRPMKGYKQLFASQYKFVTGQRSTPIQFSPSMNASAYVYVADEDVPPLDRKIVELKRSADQRRWEFVRIRTDRAADKGYWGNAFHVAEETYMNYIDKFEIEDLTEPTSYFNTTKAAPFYKQPNVYKRLVINNVINKWCKRAKWVIDEAAGRGADLKRYRDAQVENTLFIDRDTAAIAELVKRKFTSKPRGNAAIENFAMTVHTMVADLTTPSDTLIKRMLDFWIKRRSVNAIVCNFALHYLCDTETHITNLLTMNYELLAPAGIFSFTVLNGLAVHNLLKDNNGLYEVYEQDVLKYKIQALYKQAEPLADFGQNIDILLPFSKTLYSEPLCNLTTILDIALRLGFKTIYNDTITHAANDPSLGSTDELEHLTKSLTPDDLTYISLHQLVVLQK